MDSKITVDDLKENFSNVSKLLADKLQRELEREDS